MSVNIIQEASEFPSHIEAPGSYPIAIDEKALIWYDMGRKRPLKLKDYRDDGHIELFSMRTKAGVMKFLTALIDLQWAKTRKLETLTNMMFRKRPLQIGKALELILINGYLIESEPIIHTWKGCDVLHKDPDAVRYPVEGLNVNDHSTYVRTVKVPKGFDSKLIHSVCIYRGTTGGVRGVVKVLSIESETTVRVKILALTQTNISEDGLLYPIWISPELPGAQ